MKRFLLIVLLALFLRLLAFNTIPPGVANDELNIAINAQSILKTGTNIPGVVTGIIGRSSGDLSFGIHSEFSSYIIVPFIALFGFNLIAIKIPFMLASLGIVITGYFITKKLFNERAALIAMAVLAVSPWLIFFGRAAYESILSSFFFLLSTLLIINLKGWKKNFALIPLLAAFLCYFSAKTLLIPISISASFASLILNKRNDIKPLLVLNTVVIIFVAGYLILLAKSPAGARINELKSSSFSQTVNIKRTASLESPLATLFENKLVEDLRIRITASLGEFNPNYLFFGGQPETIPSLSIPDHAFMYLVDIPLILLGLVFLAKKHKRQLSILVMFIATTMLPNFLNLQGTTYSIRTVILFPMLAIISAIGIFSIKNKVVVIVVSAIYAIFVLNFCYVYFTRLPIERSEAWFLSQRVMSKYIKATEIKNPQKKIVVITDQPKLTFYKYLFYSGNYVNSESITAINNNITKRVYEVGNIEMTSDCPTDLNTQKDSLIIENVNSDCLKVSGASIKSINDAGDVFFISKDVLCQDLPKNKYPLIKNRKMLNIEALSIPDFCANYISDSRLTKLSR